MTNKLKTNKQNCKIKPKSVSRKCFAAFISAALFSTALFVAVIAPAQVSAQSPIPALSITGCTDGTYVNTTNNPRVAGENNDLVEDCQALVAMQNSWAAADNSTLGSGHPLRRWGVGGNVLITSWPGVTVSGGRVTFLALDSGGLRGSIPAAIGGLTELTQLHLFDNQLSGSIPAEIGNLSKLAHIYISGNQLTGSFPAQIGNLTSLSIFSFFGNRISGSIPAEVCSMASLTRIDGGRNLFSGSLPTCLDDLTELAHLSLHSSNLSGSIPTQLGSLDKLAKIYLHNNQLTGSIPTEVASLATPGTGVLDTLGFCDNRLSGAVPAVLQSGFTLYNYPTARGFDPIQCQTSTLSMLSPAGCTDGTFVDLAANPRVQGDNNDLAEDCQALVAIYNSLNSARWDDDLRQWGVGSNQKIDTWPGVTVAASRVTQIDLDDKKLTGTIAAQIGALTSLTNLQLDNNRLSGTIPTQLGTLATSGALTTLSICSNYLSGSIPTALQSGVTLTNYPTSQGYAKVACQVASNIVFTPPSETIKVLASTFIVFNAASYATDGDYAITCAYAPDTDPAITSIARNGCNYTVSVSGSTGSASFIVTYMSAGGSTYTATISLSITPALFAIDPITPPQNQPTSEQPTTPQPADQTPDPDASDPDSSDPDATTDPDPDATTDPDPDTTPDPDTSDPDTTTAPDPDSTATTLEPDQPGPRWNTLTVQTDGTTASRIRQAFNLATAQSIYMWNTATQTWTRVTNPSQAIPEGTPVSFRTEEAISNTNARTSNLHGGTTRTRLNAGWNIISLPEAITLTNNRDFLMDGSLSDCRSQQGVIAIANYSARSRLWSLWLPCHLAAQRRLTTGDNAPYRPLTSIAPADTTYIYTRTQTPITINWNPQTQTYQQP